MTSSISIDRLLKAYIGENELKEISHALLAFVDIIGWRDIKSWSEFFGGFKTPQCNIKHLEQRIAANISHYRSNYIAISLGITLLSLLFSPILFILILLFIIFSIYFNLLLKSNIIIGDITITSKGKKYVSLSIFLILLGITGGLIKMIWVLFYCTVTCSTHMLLRPRSVIAHASKDLKLSDVNWLGIAHHKASQENDPENPPDHNNDNQAHESHGYGFTADSIRKREKK